MPKDFGPPERAPVLPRKKTLGSVILFIGFDKGPAGDRCTLFCSQVV